HGPERFRPWSVSIPVPRLRNAAVAAAGHALTAAAAYTVIARLTNTTRHAFMVGAAAAFVYGTTVALSAGGWTSARYHLTHLRLVCTGRLPLRPEAFLRDAHHRTVLRRAGTIYQFRHAFLQDHLAEQGRVKELRARAVAGNRDAARRLADLLTKQGQMEE